MILIALVWIVGALATTFVGGAFVNTYLETFARKLKDEHEKIIDKPAEETGSSRGFENAGKLIGQLERFLIYLFVTAGRLEGVGFLVAAKSVFRFGELTNRRNRLEAEYITIGTMLSFGWGLGVSLLTNLIIAAMKAA
jgi:hypothetical protein